MLRTRKLRTLGVAIGLSAFIACGGEAGDQEAAGGEMASGQEMAQASEEGGAMEEQGMQQEGMAQLPDGVTQEMVQEGKQLFTGAGLCSVCHGNDATGMPGLGADLTDDEWIHGDGSYEFLVENIKNGVTAAESTSGTAMPPKGGSSITDEQVRAVAAYVWTLSHGGS